MNEHGGAGGTAGPILKYLEKCLSQWISMLWNILVQVRYQASHVGQISVKICNSKFHKNQCGDSHTTACEQTDRQARQGYTVLYTYWCWKERLGMSPASVWSSSPSRYACHQLGSSWLITCKTSPFWKLIPNSRHGM